MIYNTNNWLNIFKQKFKQRQTFIDVADIVKAIIEDVKNRGDTAIYDYTLKFDNHRPQSLQMDTATMQRADSTPVAIKKALDTAAERIRNFHQLSIPSDISHTDNLGVKMGVKWQPLSRVGLYVPGGTAVYPSSVLMNAIPAMVAGVEHIAMCVPTPDGVINPALLYAAKLAGINVIHPIGGVQAIAAMAFGSNSVTAVDKIVGPGNAFVAEAKRQVMGQVGIDSYAGPSEVLIIADKTQNPTWLAWDLLAQAEHDPRAQSILITDSIEIAETTIKTIEKILPTLPRHETTSKSWHDYGMIIHVDDIIRDTPNIIATIAPEHLQLCTDKADAIIPHVRHVGSLFIGNTTPEAIGDYMAGPNHVLPTCGTARFASGLSVYDFFRRMTYLNTPPSAIAKLGLPAAEIAKCEGLTCHENSLLARINNDD